MNNHKQYSRRHYFINKEFQGRQIWNYFLLVAVGSLLFIGLFSFFSSNTLSITYDNYHLQLGLTPGILLRKLLYAQWFFIVLGGGVVILITLFLTHRIAGPFYRFEKALDEMIQGNISRKIFLRQKDEGKELAKKINSFNGILADKLSLIKTFSSNIETASAQMEKMLKTSETDIEKLPSLLNEIKNNQRKIRDIIDGYKFSSKKNQEIL